MARKIQIDIEVNGKMQKATVDAKKLNAQLQGVEDGMDNISKSARQTDRNIKGTAQASSNASKNFSKMQQGMGGLVGAYASLAASLFAVSAAFNFLKSAGELKSLQAGQIAYASATGVAMRTLTNDLIAATDAQIQFRDAAQAAAIGTAAGLNADQLNRLAVAAKDASQILGRDVTDSFNRLIRGATKAEPELLDELGIILRLDTATQNYKDALNITGRELTAFERTQAVANEILGQSEKKYSAILEIIGRSPNQYAQLGKAFDDIIMKVKAVVDQIVGPFAKVLQDTPALGVAALGLLLSGPLKALGISFGGLAVAAQDAADRQRDFYQSVREEVIQAQKTTKDFKNDLQALAKVGMADGGKAGFLTKLAAGEDLSGADAARFRKAVDAAENHVNSAGVVVKGAFTGMRIHMVREMDEAFRNMRGEMDKTLSKTQLFALQGKAVMSGFAASIRDVGASMATAAARIINAIGLIGMAYSIYQVFKGMNQSEADVEAEKAKQDLEGIRKKVESLNDEYEKFIEVQKELIRETSGSNTFARNMQGFLGAQTAEEIAETTIELKKLEGQARKTERSFTDYLMMAGIVAVGVGASIFTGGLTLPAVATGLMYGTAGAGALYGAQETGMLGFGNIEQGKDEEAAIASQQERLNSMKKTLLAVGTEGGTVYKQFVALETAMSLFQNDPDNENIAKAFKKAYKEAQAFSGELNNTFQRITTINKLVKDLALSYTNITPEGRAIDTIEQQIASLQAERDSIIGGDGSRKARIDELIGGLENQRGILAEIDAEAHDNAMDLLRLKRKQKDAVQGESDSQKALREAENDRLAIQNEKVALLREENRLNKAMSLVMQQQGFKGTAEQFQDTAAGVEFKRAFEKVEIKLKINQDSLDQVEETIANIADLPNLEAHKSIHQYKLRDFELSKQMLGHKKAELDLAKAELALQQQRSDNRIQAAQDEERLTNPFYYIDADRKRAQMQLDAAKKQRQAVMDSIDKERDLKIQMIKLEADMLKERRALALLELKIARTKLDEDSDLFPEVSNQILEMEEDTPGFNESLDRSTNAAIKAENTRATAAKEQTEENIRLKQVELELTNELRLAMEDAAQSMEEGFTNAFASIIDGSMSAKEAFRSMAEAMLQEISRIIARLLVQKAIMAAMNMIGGMFGAPAGAVRPGLSASSMAIDSAATARAGASGSAGIDAMINSIANSGRYGGIMKKGYSAGGIARGSDAGYLAKLHGTEAVVPLPNGRSIPVEMSNAGAQTNNVSVNVNVNNDGTAETTSEGDSREMGRAIAAAVQREIQTQKRPGGLLSPYGSR